MLTSSRRFQSSHANVHSGLQAERAAVHLRRLLAQRDDVRKLPEDA